MSGVLTIGSLDPAFEAAVRVDGEPVILEIPRGNYAPVFRDREPEGPVGLGTGRAFAADGV